MPPARLPPSFDELPSEPAERRRIQNRIAQRKFRQKQSHKRKLETAKQNPDASLSAEHEPQNGPGISGLGPFQLDVAFDLDQTSVNTFDFVDPNDTFQSVFDSIPSLTDAAETASQIYPHDPEIAELPARGQFITPAEIPSQASQDDLALVGPAPTKRKRRSDSNSVLDNWLTAAHIAAEKGHDRILKMLLAQPGACVNERDSEGKTALIYAVREGHEACVRVLLACGATVDRADNITGWTSLHWAVANHDISLLRILLDHGSREPQFDVDVWDICGWTALHSAVEQAFEDGVELLIQHGANLECKARRCQITGGYTPKEIEDLVRIAIRRHQKL